MAWPAASTVTPNDEPKTTPDHRPSALPPALAFSRIALPAASMPMRTRRTLRTTAISVPPTISRGRLHTTWPDFRLLMPLGSLRILGRGSGGGSVLPAHFHAAYLRADAGDLRDPAQAQSDDLRKPRFPPRPAAAGAFWSAENEGMQSASLTMPRGISNAGWRLGRFHFTKAPRRER
jgi:hypothetical protein